MSISLNKRTIVCLIPLFLIGCNQSIESVSNHPLPTSPTPQASSSQTEDTNIKNDQQEPNSQSETGVNTEAENSTENGMEESKQLKYTLNEIFSGPIKNNENTLPSFVNYQHLSNDRKSLILLADFNLGISKTKNDIEFFKVSENFGETFGDINTSGNGLLVSNRPQLWSGMPEIKQYVSLFNVKNFKIEQPFRSLKDVYPHDVYFSESESILAYSKIESGNQDLILEPIKNTSTNTTTTGSIPEYENILTVFLTTPKTGYVITKTGNDRGNNVYDYEINNGKLSTVRKTGISSTTTTSPASRRFWVYKSQNEMAMTLFNSAQEDSLTLLSYSKEKEPQQRKIEIPRDISEKLNSELCDLKINHRGNGFAAWRTIKDSGQGLSVAKFKDYKFISILSIDNPGATSITELSNITLSDIDITLNENEDGILTITIEDTEKDSRFTEQEVSRVTGSGKIYSAFLEK